MSVKKNLKYKDRIRFLSKGFTYTFLLKIYFVNNTLLMKTKTRLITIKRTVKEIVEEKGKQVEKSFIKKFPCTINGAVPESHRMCENG